MYSETDSMILFPITPILPLLPAHTGKALSFTFFKKE